MSDVIYEIAATFFVAVSAFFIWKIRNKFGSKITLKRVFIVLLGLILIIVSTKYF